MYLTISTSLFGLPRLDLPISHPGQPLLLQLAAITFGDDGSELDQLCAPERPLIDSNTASAEVAGVHPEDALTWLTGMADRADLIIGHNIHFDLYALRVMGARLTKKDWVPKTAIYCTMINAAQLMPPLVRSPAPAGTSMVPRAPTLTEVMRLTFDENLIETPDLLANARAIYRVFRALTTMA